MPASKIEMTSYLGGTGLLCDSPEYPQSDEMMHNRTWRQNPQHAPFQAALATMNARGSSRDNFHAERAGMKIQPMALIRATNGLSLVLKFAGAGSANSGGNCGYPPDTQQDKNRFRHAKHSVFASWTVLVVSDDHSGKGLAVR
jgi:hypothetical protein